ncbi:hypothetical protein CCR85_01730 [Rhodothalassium salexigens]|uniref:glycosyltransferase n=2 Tax=Rhodothalassium salexigens TaxID=1086 RepID=UPI001911263B|nr:glycosyltransferase [Rhodothalassium salexigens]MBK5910212.1 hypothetical protein [Rhodothalassium salexigens]
MTLVQAILAGLFWTVAGLIALNGLDDLLTDLGHHGRTLWRRLWVYGRHRRACVARLPTLAERPIAILVPAWSEAEVIGPMLASLRRSVRYRRYRVYLGVYPNDPLTPGAAEAVRHTPPADRGARDRARDRAKDRARDWAGGRAGAAGDWLRIVPLDHDGPTSKADCLNALYTAARADAPAVYLLHDAEDLVDPDALTVINLLVGRYPMVQLPVEPLAQPSWFGVANHYMDEFAESHGKDLPWREAVSGGVPSAGVGCGFAADALDTLARARGGRPFRPGSLTEDYEAALSLALALGNRGGRLILARVPRRPGAPPVATRAYFPHRFSAAVRQKARWYVGIAYQGWRLLGWPGGVVRRWVLLRDRKAPLVAVLALAGYGFVGAYGGYWLTAWLDGGAAAASAPAWGAAPGTLALVQVNLALLAWRAGHRMVYTGRTYGWRQGLWALARMPVANLVNACAAVRAGWLVWGHVRSGRPLVWQKTEHSFPDPARLPGPGRRPGEPAS